MLDYTNAICYKMWPYVVSLRLKGHVVKSHLNNNGWHCCFVTLCVYSEAMNHFECLKSLLNMELLLLLEKINHKLLFCHIFMSLQ